MDGGPRLILTMAAKSSPDKAAPKRAAAPLEGAAAAAEPEATPATTPAPEPAKAPAKAAPKAVTLVALVNVPRSLTGGDPSGRIEKGDTFEVDAERAGYLVSIDYARKA